jgi:hypothetical protein
VARLNKFLPFDPGIVEAAAREVKALGCTLVVCDIAPLGIAVAECAGIPSILIENFTWDWIYSGYLPAAPGLQPAVNYLEGQFRRATKHVQTMPVCAPDPVADLTAPPAARKPRTSRVEIRASLGVSDEARLVLITMGGIPDQDATTHVLPEEDDLYFVIPGGSSHPEKNGNVILLPHNSNYYHPDLVYASDVVIGKAGYSTIAETYRAGIPFGYICRDAFRESSVLARFIQAEMQGVEIPVEDFNDRSWVKYLPQLLDLPCSVPTMPDGGRMMADFVLEI